MGDENQEIKMNLEAINTQKRILKTLRKLLEFETPSESKKETVKTIFELSESMKFLPEPKPKTSATEPLTTPLSIF